MSKENKYKYNIGGDDFLKYLKENNIEPKVRYPKVKQKKSFGKKISSQFRDIKSKFKVHRKKDDMNVHYNNGDEHVTINKREKNGPRYR